MAHYFDAEVAWAKNSPAWGGGPWSCYARVIRHLVAIVALTVGCRSAAAGQPLPKAVAGKPSPKAAAGKPSPKARLVNWGRGTTFRGLRLWVFRDDVTKGQIFALFDRNGLFGTAKVVAFEQPYEDKPCFRIAHADATRVPDDPGLAAYGPLDEVPPKAHVVDVPASEAPATDRQVVGLDLDGDEQAELAFAGRDCPGAHGYVWCIDSYVRTKTGWTAVEHYFDAEGCPGKK